MYCSGIIRWLMNPLEAYRSVCCRQQVAKNYRFWNDTLNALFVPVAHTSNVIMLTQFVTGLKKQKTFA